MAAAIQPRQDQLEQLYRQIFGDEEARPPGKPGKSTLSDDALLKKAMAATNGENFKALWNGSTAKYGGDDSAADLALLNMLAFWTNRDAVQMGRLFSKSALGQRDKWRERETYRADTIQAAISKCKDVYGAMGIQVNNRFLNDVTDDALKALIEANDPPQTFARAGQLVRLTDKDHLVIDPLNKAALRGILARATGFVTVSAGANGPEYTKVNPPGSVVEDILYLGSWPGLPRIEAIVEIPVIRPDGTILNEPGYDEATRLYYAQPCDLKAITVPEAPTKEDAEKAAQYILDEVFVDFPFKDQASKANALGLLVSLVARPAIDGCVPLALLDKPSAGTGASLIAEITALIATGRPASMMGAPETEDEWRKAITSCLIDGSSLITIDNIVGRLRSAALTRAITSRIWRDRFLGKSEMLDLLQLAVWIATGNNILIGGDFARRSYWVRMDAEMARPWMRDPKNFRHPDILSWIKENHAEILSKLLIMPRAWFVAGKPACSTPIVGGFKEWSQIVGGILEFSGVSGFLGNAAELYDNMDSDVKQWDEFLGEWSSIHADTPIKAAVLRDELASTHPIYQTLQEAMPDDIAEAIGEKSKASLRLGVVLRRHMDQVFPSGRKLCQDAKDEHAKTCLWKVVAGSLPADEPASGDDPAGSAGSSHIRAKILENKVPDRKYNGAGVLPALPADVAADSDQDAGRLPASPSVVKTEQTPISAVKIRPKSSKHELSPTYQRFLGILEMYAEKGPFAVEDLLERCFRSNIDRVQAKTWIQAKVEGGKLHRTDSGMLEASA